MRSTAGRVVFANTRRCADAVRRGPLAQLSLLGARRSLADEAARPARADRRPVRLADGRAASSSGALDGHSALRLQPAALRHRRPIAGGGARDVRPFWESPFPATLQDERLPPRRRQPRVPRLHRLRARALLGRDPIELQPRETAPPVASDASACSRRASAGPTRRPLREGRLVDAGGRERWYRAARRVLVGAGRRSRSTSRCCRTRPPSTSRASAPTVRCASSTTGSTSARSAWCCSTTAACSCAPIRPSTRWSAACRSR